MLLQGYFDDSGTHEGKNVGFNVVICGFISTAARWEAFATAWRAKLDEYPQLDYFRMSEAMALSGQFKRGWTPELRDQRILELAEITKSHAMVRVDCVMKRGWYNALVRSIPAEFDDPYYLLFVQLLWAVQDYQMQTAQPDCSLVFDVQSEIGPKILSSWQAMRDYEPREDRKKLMASLPLFGDDRILLPLQAADMYAWLVRDHLDRVIRHEHQPDSKPRPKTQKRITIDAAVKQLRQVENISREYSFEALMHIAARAMVARAKDLGFLQ